MQIVELNINDLKPYDRNPRKNDDAVEYVANSIKEFGFKVPVVIDKDNIVVAGHTRLKAAKKLGLNKIPCIIADDLNEQQIQAFRLADNKVNEVAEWDLSLLDIELGDITDIDMSDFGFNLDDDDEEEPEIEEDEAPEVPEEPKAKLGDLYILGNHRLICGDSTDINVIDRLMDGAKADMVFTDPPYGYNYQSNWREKSEKFDVLKNDDKILDFFPNLVGRVKGFVMICTTWKVLDKWIPLFKQHFELTNMIIWDKGGGGIGDLKHTFSTDYEVILCSNNGGEVKKKRIGSVWDIGSDNANDYLHPTQKPVALAVNAITHTTDDKAVVIDCFGGSGSTLIACEQTGRKCYTCELDTKYVDVIVQRYINFVGSDEDVYLIRGGEKIPYSEVDNEE